MPLNMRLLKGFSFLGRVIALIIGLPVLALAQVTVFVPSAPDIDRKDKSLEVDMLMTMMEPFQNSALSMDMPQMFAALRYEKEMEAPERRDLLGDIEEITYMGIKAWGANIAIEKGGLYQFIMETRPWWDKEEGLYIQQLCKVILPVLGIDYGWNIPAGLGFEIVPLSRPFGLTSPAFFSGRAQLLGKPQANIPVKMGRINIEKKSALTPWHEELVSVTSQSGEFVFLLNQPGWWFCEAQIPGDPIKGSDGEMKPVRFGSVIWLYVDAPDIGRKK